MRAADSTQTPHWKADLTAGFLVFLVALPLCLGIAMASGFPPIAGILTAIIGGILCTFLGGAELTIKGPAAGLIVIAIGCVQELSMGDPMGGYRRALAVGVVAAIIQIAFALLRAGRLGDVFPSSVVHGMLAAIGVTIFSKQVHTMLGVGPTSKGPIPLLLEIPHSIATMNPEICAIGVGSLLILIAMSLVARGPLKKVPGQLLVLLFAIPLGLYFDLDHAHDYNFYGHHFTVGPQYLVQLPGSILNALALPDFSMITSGPSIKYIVMFSLVGSIESLLSTKAVDALDPMQRRSNLDRDLLATGIANLLAACVGGLPMISEIVRSSANINAGAKTRWANFFHGFFLLAFVVLIPGLLQEIPMAALGAMLVFTGIRLASPRAFKHTLQIGPDQLLLFSTTLMVTLYTDLLVGVASGMALKIVLHLIRGASPKTMFRAQVERKVSEQETILEVSGSATFTNYLSLRKELDQSPTKFVVIDFSRATLVDHTVFERLDRIRKDWEAESRVLQLAGLDSHRPASAHALAMRRKVA